MIKKNHKQFRHHHRLLSIIVVLLFNKVIVRATAFSPRIFLHRYKQSRIPSADSILHSPESRPFTGNFDSSIYINLRGGEISKGESVSVSAPSNMNYVFSVFQIFGNKYASLLESSPILTKSLTAALIFGLSDWTAQKLEKKKLDRLRTFSTVLVGLLYFGPAAHAWYDMIFRLFPKTSLVSTLQKAALGQMIFGPSFTCVFFAASLIQCGNFSLGTWLAKIKSDLFGAWAAGLGFWPLVDLVSYSLLPPQWIPLFVNLCSFIWTVYLSLIANKSNQMKVE